MLSPKMKSLRESLRQSGFKLTKVSKRQYSVPDRFIATKGIKSYEITLNHWEAAQTVYRNRIKP
jgi:hypothetical protein